MASNADFLMEIMKSRTTTRQQQQQFVPADACGGMSDYDTEVREQPPKPESYAFDYYGNPITEVEDQHLQRQFRQKFRQAAASSIAAVNQVSTPTPFQQPASDVIVTREDYSEFLEVPPPPESPVKKISNDAEVDPGCVAELGNCIRVTFCCVKKDEGMAEPASFVADGMEPIGVTQEQIMMQEINDELHALQESSIKAKTSNALLEFNLRSELAEIRRQRAEMEESYRREIEREMSEKLALQAQMQAKLLNMMEERMWVEVQMDRLTACPEKSKDDEVIPTVTAYTSMSQQREKISPLSVLGEQPSVAESVTPAAAGRDGGTIARIPIEPPISTPVEPPSYETSATMLTCEPKVTQTNNTEATAATPFGLSIVVENADHDGTVSCDPEGSVVGSMGVTPSGRRSPDPESSVGASMGFTPSGGRSPLTIARSREPEGKSFDDEAVSDYRSGSPPKPSDANSIKYTQLPLPVATPVMHASAATSAFEATE
eukprot:CAMPEP_0172535178 /NCGR_PEP_ID=MMETSP1067-20121228/7300_1 /TAXON_ID=265564 ORGANISM="Thalassiosira punctigera, Strain Tpunct2005C2" /NCGR_SAMPLE_ID=MMETSP1067 /ASSEMBLY_ACC=CAM_ASM_000444 /LENGTH=488 /DNA_ID=CAMNT_0013320087 /DNA_START=75 /DNA_END=1541 /DNA_ORIENTATION=-